MNCFTCFFLLCPYRWFGRLAPPGFILTGRHKREAGVGIAPGSLTKTPAQKLKYAVNVGGAEQRRVISYTRIFSGAREDCLTKGKIYRLPAGKFAGFRIGGCLNRICNL
jgi:hypothetical protein